MTATTSLDTTDFTSAPVSNWKGICVRLIAMWMFQVFLWLLDTSVEMQISGALSWIDVNSNLCLFAVMTLWIPYRDVSFECLSLPQTLHFFQSVSSSSDV